MSYMIPHTQPLFPGLLGKFEQDLVAGGIDPVIVRGELIGFVSMLTQGVADITWPNGQAARIGSSSLVIAPSGYGKSIVFRQGMDPIEEALRQHADAPHFAEGFLTDDPTREAITQDMSQCPVSCVAAEEAGVLKRLIRESATLVKMMDGSTVRSARVSSGRVTIKEPRLAVLILAQPQVASEQLDLLRASQSSVGMPNRMYIACGDRPPHSAAIRMLGLSPEVRRQYGERTSALLAATRRHLDPDCPRPKLSLTLAGQEFLQYLTEDVRRMQHPSSQYSIIPQYVQRHPERVLSLAGALHAFVYEPEGEVDLEMLQIADCSGRSSIDTFHALSFQPPKSTQVQLDAQTIAHLIYDHRHAFHYNKITTKVLRVLAKNAGISTAQFGRALPWLAKHGLIQIGLERHTETVNASPLLQRATYSGGEYMQLYSRPY